MSNSEICDFILRNLKINDEWIHHIESNSQGGKISFYHGLSFSSDFLSFFQRWINALKLEVRSYPECIYINWVYRNDNY